MHSFNGLSVLNVLLMLRLRTLALPMFIYRGVYFRMHRTAKIVWKKRGLRIGCRWPFRRFRESEFSIMDHGTLEIDGKMGIFTGCSVKICSGATLSLGSGYINNGARITVYDKITIGSGVAISENVTFRDSDSHKIIGSTRSVSSPISVGNGVWIGMNVTVLKGVSIGDGAVIAANSLVNRDVPPNALAAGVPARVIKENIHWKR